MPIEFYILCLLVVTFFCGWFGKIAWEQFKADQKREEQARKRRQAYVHSEEFIKTINRNNTFNSWVAEAKGGVRK